MVTPISGFTGCRPISRRPTSTRSPAAVWSRRTDTAPRPSAFRPVAACSPDVSRGASTSTTTVRPSTDSTSKQPSPSGCATRVTPPPSSGNGISDRPRRSPRTDSNTSFRRTRNGPSPRTFRSMERIVPWATCRRRPITSMRARRPPPRSSSGIANGPSSSMWPIAPRTRPSMRHNTTRTAFPARCRNAVAPPSACSPRSMTESA